MPLLGWNHVWTARDMAGYTHSGLIAPYFVALYERVCALNAVGAGGGAHTVSPGEPVMFAEDHSVFAEGVGWGAIQSWIAGNASFFVRKSGGYTPQGKWGIDSPNVAVDGSGGLSFLPFPYPNGWTRKLPREIWRLSYPGSAGQRARFTARLGTNWYGDLSTADPATTGFGLAVTTPYDQQKWSCVMFVHNGSAWQPSADQISSPDVLSEYLVPTGTPPRGGFYGPYYYPGDYFGPWVPNDLRDAFNQMTIVPTRTDALLDPDPNIIAYANGDRALTLIAGADHIRSGSDPTSIAAAQAAYNAAATTTGFYGDPTEGWTSAIGGGGPFSFYAVAQAAKTKSTATGGAWPNPLSQNCQLSFWIRAYLGGWYYIYDVFDAFGGPVLDRQWAELTPRVTTADPSSITNYFGYIPATAPAYTTPGTNRGWEARDFSNVILADYEVAGGFQYTASTP